MDKTHTYTRINLTYGSVIVFGEGKTRDVFHDSVSNMELPKVVGDGLELLMQGLYEETGEIQTLTIFNDGEFNLSKANNG